jgi:predicted nucleotidyltransferase
VDPGTARNIARACHDHWSTTAAIANQVHVPAGALTPMLRQLADAGYLEQRDGRDGDRAEWNTTITGGALTMASFLKPVSRARAEKLLAGVLERAAGYNTDDAKLYVITEIAVFGSYLRTEAAALGDLDLVVKFEGRGPGATDPETVFAYAKASGRNFQTLFATIAWPEMELMQLLRNRSGYINVHTEDISRFTDDWRVVYRDAEPEWPPAP